MDSSFLTFSPKALSRKKVSGNIVRGPTKSRLLKPKILPLRDVHCSPSNLHNIEKNRRESVGSTNKNSSTVAFDDSVILLSDNTKRVGKIASSCIPKLISNEQRSNEKCSLVTSDSMKDKQLRSSESDKFEEIRNWLNELHVAHEKKRYTPPWSSLNTSSSVIECSTSDCPPKLGTKNASDWRIPETSSDGSVESLKQKSCADLVSTDHIKKSVGKTASNELNRSNGENVRSLGSSLSTSNSVIECSPSSDCPQNFNIKSTQNWRIPESSSDESINSLKQKSLDHVSYDHVTKLARKDTSNEIIPGSSDDEIVKPVRRKKTCLVFSDSECDGDSSDHSRLSTVAKTTGEVISDKPREETCNTSSPSNKKYGSDKCSRLSNYSDDSIISVSSADRILTALYGKNWDKESVLTPVVQKKKMVIRKPAQKEDITSIDATLSEFYGSNWDKEKVLTPLVKRQKAIKGKENTPPVIEKKRNIERPFETPKTELPVISKSTKSCPSRRGVSKNNNSQETRSFLQSLSACSPKRCHPEALLYKKEFKKNKEELCTYLFKLYNREVFENKLPFNLKIDWNVRMNRTAGFCYNSSVLGSKGKIRSSRIELSTKVCSTTDRVRDTLIHELCHAAAWVLNGIKKGHGAEWKTWTKKAMTRFPELPRIGRCHAYNIETKYTYKCKSCGYSFGRHSKSLDLQRKRCGYCYGEFELLVNIKTKNADAGVKSTPRTPRAASGFALYVKENYKATKEKNSGLKHAEIMKLLGNHFAALKVGSAQ